MDPEKEKGIEAGTASKYTTDISGKKIAILGGSTTRDIRDILELFLLNYGIRPCFYESEYNQYYADGMFPNPALEEFHPDILYIHTSNRNIEQYPSLEDDRALVTQKLRAEYERFQALWEHLHAVYGCPVIQNNFEPPLYRLLGNRDASDHRGRWNYIQRLNQMFYEYADTHQDFYIHDICYEAADYGLERWSDPFYWNMYKYAMCVPAIPYTAFQLARIIKSIFGRNKKVLNLDLDNTLWGGVIGDDGPENIEIGQETSLGQTYAEFQDYLKQHKKLGVLLSVNSKIMKKRHCQVWNGRTVF